MLCARFGAAGGPARINVIRDAIAKHHLDNQEAYNAEANALEIFQKTLCR